MGPALQITKRMVKAVLLYMLCQVERITLRRRWPGPGDNVARSHSDLSSGCVTVVEDVCVEVWSWKGWPLAHDVVRGMTEKTCMANANNIKAKMMLARKANEAMM